MAESKPGNVKLCRVFV